MNARTSLLATLAPGLSAGLVALAGLAACTGGPGALDSIDVGPEAPPISGERPRTSATEDPNGGQQGSSADDQGSSGSTTPKSACPPCGTYACTGTSSALPFTKQQDGSCGITGSLSLNCSGKIVDGNGNVIGTWSGSGTTVTLTPASGPRTTCSVGSGPAPTPEPEPQPAPAPTPTPVFDAGA